MGLFDLASVALMGAEAVTVTRSSKTLNAATGLYSDTTSTFQALAHVQPLSTRDLEMLRELEEVQDARAVFTDIALVVGMDSVTYQGQTWRVVKSGDWKHLGNYYESVIALD